jgi:hypothetical protein
MEAKNNSSVWMWAGGTGLTLSLQEVSEPTLIRQKLWETSLLSPTTDTVFPLKPELS